MRTSEFGFLRKARRIVIATLTCHLLVGAAVLSQAAEAGERARASREIAEQAKILNSIYCKFVRSEEPTPEFIALVIAEKKRPSADAKRIRGTKITATSSDDIKKRYSEKTEVTFVETRDQRYYLRVLANVDSANTTAVEDGRSYDKKSQWGWRKVALKDGTDSIDVEKGIDPQRPKVAEELLQTGVITRKFLALSLHKASVSLIQQVLSDPSTIVLPDQIVDGATCTVFQWVEKMGTYDRRTTLWLDKEKRHALRKLRQESKTKKSEDWTLYQTFVTTMIDSTVLAAEDRPGIPVWFPSQVQTSTYNQSGACTFKGTVTVTDYRLNADVTSVAFTPKIEDGTNFRDAVTGKNSVYGKGPSPRIRTMIQKRVEESREQLKDLENVDLSKAQAPPWIWPDALPWAAAGLGLIGLLVVASRRLVGRSKA